jgi:hypothetical protein
MRLPMSKRQRHEHIMRRARELAESGKFASWDQIEFELRYREELPEARGVLDSRFIRDELDQTCAQARAKQGQYA